MVDFSIIWRYMAWSNQTLATIVLWAITIYLVKEKKLYIITLIPSLFMTAVVTTYILIAPEGFQLDYNTYIYSGVIAATVSLVFFIIFKSKNK
jgi:carbon starvation protein CstA